MLIREDGLQSLGVAALLGVHLAHMNDNSPAESVHALDLEALRRPEITFWTAWDRDDLLGCGALMELDAAHGEIKSMHTVEAHRGKGIAGHILRYMIDVARQRAYHRLSLETGSSGAFAAAQALYAGHGFLPCAPFAAYVADPHSMFMTLDLAES
ncbi:MAG: GNAT family N-acetyltransferase [Alphaproteobacteria bacterium]|jgi:putative acetyltransferase|nr:GNAT family N-acetyltransferase [Alphaproteobacteria bacterium]MDP6874428.1 GNAT family N-acetyltransferase [Alphaproteobacteria bacterium]